MRLVSSSWRDAVTYAKVEVRPGGERFAADADRPDHPDHPDHPESPSFLRRVAVVDLNSRHVTWVMNRSHVHLVAPFISSSTEALVMDNVQQPDVLGALLAMKSVELQSLRRLSLQKSSVSDADLAGALAGLPGLEMLDVSGSMFLRGDFLNALCDDGVVPRLRCLRMAGCGMHVESYRSAWENVAAGGRGLEELVVCGNVLGDSELRCLGGLKETLRYLDVRRCSDVTFDGVYHVGNVLRLETFKVGPVFGVGVEEVWDALSRRARSSVGDRDRDCDCDRDRLVNLELFGMEDAGGGADPQSPDRERLRFARLRMVSFMDTSVCWQRLGALRHVEYLNVSRSLPVSINAANGNEYYGAGLAHAVSVAGLAFPRLKTFKASNSSLPWHVVQAVLEGAPGLVDLDLSGWEGLRASRLVSSAAHAEMVERFSDALCGLRQLETLRMPGTHLVDGHVRRFFSLGGGRLRVLDLSSNPHLTGCLGSGDGHLEVLEVMSIANTGIQLWRTGAPTTLRELGVSGSNFSRDDQDGAGSMDSFVRLVRRAPTLEKLHMTDVDALTDAALTDILRSCPRLEDVSVAGCSSLTPKGLGPLAELSKLVKLDVSRLRQAVTDDNLASVLSRHTLTELRASGADLTPASLDAMLQSKMLHYVDVSFCFGMGDDERCGEVVSQSGSPIKIRLPRGSARLGLFNDDRRDRDEVPDEAADGIGRPQAGRRLAFE